MSDCQNIELVFTSSEIASIVKDLKNGKACGKDGLQAEHLKYASSKVAVLLTLLFNSMVLHGHLSQNLMETTLIPILKDKKGDISSKDNYRPIAITSVISKLFEAVILYRYQDCLQTTDNQFGFKSKHSTDMCIFTMKHVVDYYTSMSSPVFLCYLDASKAFDRLNFWVLFDKLLERKIPPIIVRILVFWYTNQQCVVKWGNSLSCSFTVSNGVRQGGVLSPYFFNVYMDNLSSLLNMCNAGCVINGTSFNHLMYADDTVLIAPSASGLQKLLQICETYAVECDIIFNVKKTKCIVVKPKLLKKLNMPTVYLNGKALNFVSSHKYLGVLFCDDQRDDDDITKHIRGLYSRGNVLTKNFRQCSDDVKCLLFKAYCSNFYCSQLWVNCSKESLRRLKVAYNNIFRILFKCEHDVSISYMYMVHGIDHFDVLARKAITKFLTRVNKSGNVLIKTIVNSLFFMKGRLNGAWCNKLHLNKS